MAQIHRYGERVALSVTGATRYLRPDDAKVIALAILRCVDSIETEGFARSTFPTVTAPDFDIHGQDRDESK